MLDETGSGGLSRAAESQATAARRAAWSAFRRIKAALARLGFRRVPGGKRLNRFLTRKLRPPGVVLLESHGNLIYADPRDEGVVPLLRSPGAYEEYETTLFASLLEPGMVVVDIGANIGHYSLLAARAVGKSGHVYAFEPDPRNFDLLTRSIRVNGLTNVTAVNKAVSRAPGTVTLYRDKYNLGGHSFASENLTTGDGKAEVEAVTLDSFFPAGIRVDVIKLDTQGAEGFVFEGGRRLLGQSGVKIMMELWPFGLRNVGYDPAELTAGLERLGFEFALIDPEEGETRPMSRHELGELCERLHGSAEHVNIFLRKP